MPILSKPTFYDHSMEDLTEMPAGGWFNLIALGFVFPAVVMWFGFNAWTTEHAKLMFGVSNADEVSGLPALGAAVALVGIGLFAHFRWCWGLAGFWKTFRIGIGVSMIAIISGICYALWHLYFGGYTMH